MEVIFKMFYKPEIRKAIRARRKNLDPLAIQQASLQVAAQLIHSSRLIESKHIGYYLPHENEIDPYHIISRTQYQDKLLYLPVVDPADNKTLTFYSFNIEEKLQLNRYGILEPFIENKKPFDILQLDIVFVPLVCFDEYCNRIGRGAGYYDRTFAFIKDSIISQRPYLIGLGYEFQKIEKIVPSAWDIPLDMVVTEREIYRR
jgi:5-formyltetrahydrofolate cyclo-ligase